MPEFDIDQMKNVWKKQTLPKTYSSGRIQDILKHRSKNDVKYILWISLLEFTFFILFSFFYAWEGDPSRLYDIFHKLGIDYTETAQKSIINLYIALKAISLLVTVYFVIRFYRAYRSIHIESNLKKFIQQLLQFRITVRYFIYANITLAVAFFPSIAWLIYHNLQSQKIKISAEKMQILLFISTFAMLLVASFAWGYYRIVYGTFIRRLNKYLAQLQSTEEELNE